MTETEINVAVAECLGWKRIEHLKSCWRNSDSCRNAIGVHDLPNYCADLNLCAQFEAALRDQPDYQLCNQYSGFIAEILERKVLADDPTCIPDVDGFETITADAPTRCQAYLRVKGKWKE